jgi:hypothetical protein
MRGFLTFLLGLAIVGLAGSAMAAPGVDVTLDKDQITIGTFYNGTTLGVSGQIPAGCQAVIRVLGQPQELHMKQKGRALGVLWMNLDPVNFKEVPALCLVQSSGSLKDMGVADSLGLAGLQERIAVESKAVEPGWAKKELIKLKQSENLYQEHDRSVDLGEDASGSTRAFEAQIQVPSRMSPGDYTVEVFAVKDGQVAAQTVKTVTARLTGAPAVMAEMAFGHGALYGIMAALIAILGGLIIGRIFQGAKGGAH